MRSLLLTVVIALLLSIVLFSVESNQQNISGPDLASEAPIVRTSLGLIAGSILQSLNGSDFFAYRGIHYAQAPTGERRFAAPVPVEPWNGTLQAIRDKLVCPQPGIKLLMTEDCLVLNVYTRNLTGNSSVVVYIHGGGNIIGSGHSEYEAGPQYLLDHDLVLVTFNYRLGAFGFLSTVSNEAPGNFGYLDQVLALKWVQSHISNFGGNPNRVTLMGLSAGSMAVTLHMASPLSKGLFHRAFALSGSATNHYNIDNLYWTRKLARELSCPMYNPKDVLDCLRKLKWQRIIDVCAQWEPYGFINMKWNYEIDGHFLHEHPVSIFKKGNFSQVPTIVSITRDELDFTIYPQENNTGLLNDISLNFNLYAPEIFLYDGAADQSNPSIASRLKQFYLKDSNITQENIEKFGEIFSDSLLGHGIHRLVDTARRHMPIYILRNDYVGERSLTVDRLGKPRGVGHGDDLQYIMPGSWYGKQFKPDSPDLFMVHRMTKLIYDFANNGTPGIENWKPTQGDKVLILYNRKETVCEGPEDIYFARYKFWDSLFPLPATSSASKASPFFFSFLNAY